MIMKNAAAGLAAGTVLALFLGAGAAQAGFSTPSTVAVTSQTPGASTPGGSVTLGVTVTPGDAVSTCTGSVLISDAASPVSCTASLTPGAGASTGSCSVGFPTAGVRTLNLAYTSGNGICANSAGTASHTVNAAPAAVPTVGEWTMWGLAGLLLIGGGMVASRRFNIAREI
ncbi:hypothetical protein [Brevundimonas sp.]|uniref:hypothetical protein n=1 Tax=Brevundimonas sp. TaxID=1871086 RepID=UPI002EDA67A4